MTCNDTAANVRQSFGKSGHRLLRDAKQEHGGSAEVFMYSSK